MRYIKDKQWSLKQDNSTFSQHKLMFETIFNMSLLDLPIPYQITNYYHFVVGLMLLPTGSCVSDAMC